MPAKVYYTNLRTDSKAGLLDKMERLFKQAGLNKVIDEGDLVAVKLHLGNWGIWRTYAPLICVAWCK